MCAKRERNHSSAAAAATISPESGGCLYLVGTPIGNLEDITLRALRILKEVDLIACEDTRHTQKLLNHYDIQKSLVSYHEHNEMTRSSELLIKLEDGARIALVSDAGMPLVSDPGYRLVTLCVRHKIPVVPVPGPSAMLAALAAAGLPNEEFLFVGFLPHRRAHHDFLRSAASRGGVHRRCTGHSRRPPCLYCPRSHQAPRGVPARQTLATGRIASGAAGARRNYPRSGSARTVRNHRASRFPAKLAAKERGLTRRAAYEQLVESKAKPD